MKVKAKVQGQYKGVMVHPGEIFEIEPDDNYPAPWMEVVEPSIEKPEEEAVAPVIEVEEPQAPAKEVVSEEQKTKKKRWFK